jgi:hypothetical protein
MTVKRIAGILSTKLRTMATARTQRLRLAAFALGCTVNPSKLPLAVRKQAVARYQFPFLSHTHRAQQLVSILFYNSVAERIGLRIQSACRQFPPLTLRVVAVLASP